VKDFTLYEHMSSPAVLSMLFKLDIHNTYACMAFSSQVRNSRCV